MGKNAALLLVLVFLVASFLVGAESSSGAAVAENSWTTKAPMREARAYLGVAAVNGKIYAVGGDNGSLTGNLIPEITLTGDFVKTTEEYDPTTNTWTEKSPMPTPRASFGTAVYQNKIYCAGGYTNGGETGVNEVYDPITDTWETKAPMPIAISRLAANVVRGKVYVLGSSYWYNNSINEVYDPSTDSWAVKASSPHETTTCVLGVVDDKIYSIGTSMSSDSSNPNWVGPFMQIYDAINDSWSLGGRAPTYGLTAVAGVASGVGVPKRIYLFEDNATHVYDPATNNWTDSLPMRTARYCAGVASIDDTFYVVGGRSGSTGYIVIMQPSTVNEQYLPFEYGSVPPPSVHVVSPENKTYEVVSVPLTFVVNEPVLWVGYSLDGQENMTITGNATLAELSNGLHNVRVYVNDTLGNTGASDTIIFSIAGPEPFPTAPVAAASVASVALAAVGVLVYFRKRKRQTFNA